MTVAIAATGVFGMRVSSQTPARPIALTKPIVLNRTLAPADLNIPLSFEANVGQLDGRVRFVAHGPGYGLSLTGNQAILALQHSGAQRATKDRARFMPAALIEQPAVMRLEFLGANPAARTVGLDPLAARINYFVGNDPERWHTGVPAYARVKYERLYPGIDLVYYGNRRSLEFDLIVAPGANPELVRFAVGGGKAHLDAAGDLMLGEPGRELTLRKPCIYQQAGTTKLPIDGGYRIVPATDGRTQTIAIALANYDHTRALVIDPQLVYSTYFADGATLVSGIAIDGKKFAYLAGLTYSPQFPVTSGAVQRVGTAQGGDIYSANVFVAVINPAAQPASQLVYSSYLGGHAGGVGESNTPPGDFASALAVDQSGEIYLTGATESADFPVTDSAFQSTNKALIAIGTDTAFVTVINPNVSGRSGLRYSSFLGGSGFFPDESGDDGPLGDQGTALALDSRGFAYVTGFTASSDFPVTKGAFQASNNGLANAFVSVINPGAFGSASLVYSSYLGGSDFDFGGFPAGEQPSGIRVSSSGTIYVAGTTASTDFPVTKGAFQAINQSTQIAGTQGFLTVLNPTRPAASQLVYSTYLGGEVNDAVNAMAIDSAGHAYLVGTTQSSAFPTTTNAYHLGPNSGDAAMLDSAGFLSVVNPGASGNESLLYSTLLHGATFNGTADPTGVAVGTNGLVYLGLQVSSDFPVTANAFQPQLETYGSAVSVFNPAASGDASLQYSTFFGGANNGGSDVISLAVSEGSVYVAGSTAALDFPLTANAMNTTPSFLGPFLSVLDLPVSPPSPAPKPVAASLQLSAATLQFPPTVGTASGTASQPVSITITNPKPKGLGKFPVTIEGLATGGDFQIDHASSTCVSGQALPSGGSCAVAMTFEPTAGGTRNGVLIVTDNGKNSPHQVALTGTTAPGALQIDTSGFDSPTAKTSTSVYMGGVSLSNPSLEPITISNVTVSNSQFAATFIPVACPAVPALGGCTLGLTFTPTATGLQSATLSIFDDATNRPQTVTLTGTGD